MFGLRANKILTVKPDSAFCVRMYHKKAECRDCLDACTEDAVIIGRPGTGISIDETKCINCGKCVGVCAYGAFKRSGTTEDIFCSFMLDKAKSGLLQLSCRETIIKRVYRLECLGELHAVNLLWLLTKGISSFFFHHGACSECRLQNGCDILGKQIDSIRNLCESLSGVNLTVETHEDKIVLTAEGFPSVKAAGPVNLNRRGFFKHIGMEMTLGLANTLDVFSAQEYKPVSFSGNRKKPSQRQMLLLAVLTVLKGNFSNPFHYDRNLPVCEMDIDESRCSRCGLCVRLCPTGSLSLSDGRVVYSSDFCSGCQTCIKACTEKCFSVKVNFIPR
ncbi:4Fe-4S binding protein [Geovibrio ferrireducens]|jgi:ferredoxin|uniref:4Fe-4S binding protein n=1 Tax=Geovibrio ferrireducens TaxID=46201 RepID=UPI00224508E4|nr:4Fe-4S binding protein [Geovibrio ferrireducens]